LAEQQQRRQQQSRAASDATDATEKAAEKKLKEATLQAIKTQQVAHDAEEKARQAEQQQAQRQQQQQAQMVAGAAAAAQAATTELASRAADVSTVVSAASSTAAAATAATATAAPAAAAAPSSTAPERLEERPPPAVTQSASPPAVTQAEAAAGAAASRCPAAKPPRGLLYNHLSKTGGTAMKEMLKLAMDAPSPTVSFVNVNGHVHDTDAVGALGALVIQDDTAHELQLAPTDAAAFFVIGLIRRPCDYMVSYWAYTSDRQRKLHTEADTGKWGLHPPYSGDDDLARFTKWLSTVVMMRDGGRSWLQGSTFMSQALHDRIPDPSLVHCWVTTHRMVDDLKRCMKQYEACGGTWAETGLTAANIAEAAKRTAGFSDGDIRPSPHAGCSTYFKNATLMKLVMDSEEAVIRDYHLDSCCG